MALQCCRLFHGTGTLVEYKTTEGKLNGIVVLQTILPLGGTSTVELYGTPSISQQVIGTVVEYETTECTLDGIVVQTIPPLGGTGTVVEYKTTEGTLDGVVVLQTIPPLGSTSTVELDGTPTISRQVTYTGWYCSAVDYSTGTRMVVEYETVEGTLNGIVMLQTIPLLVGTESVELDSSQSTSWEST